MNDLILPLIMIVLCTISLIVIVIIKKMKKSNSKTVISEQDKTAQDFVNVKDIKGMFLYTRDNYIISYIKVTSISIDLLSERERKSIERTITAELSSEDKPFKFLAVPRPIDITSLVNEYMDIIAESSDQVQKELLRYEIQNITNYALSGEVIERQFYYMFWEKQGEYAETDLSKRTKEFAYKLSNKGDKSIHCEILEEDEIIRLVNLVNNPAFTALDDIDVAASIPILNRRGGLPNEGN